MTKIQLRHDTAANWTSVNPILLEGEVGIETDTRKQKFGDGVTAWNSLPYDLGSTAARVLYVEYGVTTYSEIYNAYFFGTQISCVYNHLIYTLDNYRDNKFAFTAIDNSNSTQQYSNNSKIKIKCFTVSNNNVYSEITIKEPIYSTNSSTVTISTTNSSITNPLTLRSNNIDCWQGFEGSNGWLGSYGVDSTQSPVFYDGTLQHFATQEWIGTQGYLTSITSSNVTSALGYTPVNKAGDTMTGELIISANSPYQGLRMNDTGQVAGTTPSSERIIGMRFYDNNGTYVGYIQNTYGTDGSRKLLLNCRNSAGNKSGTMMIGFNANDGFISELPSCQDNNSIVTTVSKSKSQNGYYKLGNGLIIQWGTVASTTGTTGQVTLPTAFTTSNYQIAYGSSTNLSIGTTSQTTTNFDWNKASTNASINWIAIGY